MSPAFLLNYVTGRRKLHKSKLIDGCIEYFFQKKNICKETIKAFFMFVCTMVLYEYMKSLRYDANNLLTTHVPIKIYRTFYHSSIHIANEPHQCIFIFQFLSTLNPELQIYMQLCPYLILSFRLFCLVPSLSRSLKYNKNNIFFFFNKWVINGG